MGLINPETGSKVDIEDDGDYTITFSMSLPPQPANGAEED